ncbi:serine hydrolase domain-containing protein [Xanthomonas sp. NCPPB 2654]|uniref:serine hydrolase domain-containing protein n=1 Tax=unclassified Xanthomonas TaxID=2643310 RepID=UPI0021DF4687|nr:MULTISPECIES: serine hydrolase domain-containing protein [unclassified Xanthomonas]MDL5365430.1 serine hydrolase domain-containing protein [Xanthomonas sp. NCPPB 2654]UYC20123.1 beta-lactamase family protein [Xanthomonas sp. CFBP 8443]
MNRTPSLALLLGVALLPCVASANDALAPALTRQMEVNRQRYGIAGQALLVTHDGKVLFRGADGEADTSTHTRLDADAVFAGYSLSKLFVSTLVMQLVEQGQLDLQAPIGTYVAGLPVRWRSIAVRDFLDHTSGVPEYFDNRSGEAAASVAALPADREAAFASLTNAPLLFEPGTDIRYTQTNYLVLTALLEAHYGQPYAQVAGERIIRKLHLRHTWLGPAAIPARGVVTSYVGRHGRLQKEQDLAWPRYAYGHASLYITLDDLGRFLQAMSSGELVDKATLRRLWQPRILAGDRRGWFASGWEYGESGAYRQVGHDGGARVRVRMLFRDTPDADVYVFAYLTNGSASNVWSRTLVDSAMATVAPERFPMEALSETLMRYATQIPSAIDARTQAHAIRASTQIDDAALERAIDTAGNGIRENLGLERALRVFALNTVLFPRSANAWDSLAEAYAAKGEPHKAKRLHAKARLLSRQP